MLSKKEQIALKIKKLELINNETCQFYSENGFKCHVLSLDQKLDSLKDEPKMFMDSLNVSDDLDLLEKELDNHVDLALAELNQLKGGNNV